MADSWGIERAVETNVPRILAHWLNTRPPGKQPLERNLSHIYLLYKLSYFDNSNLIRHFGRFEGASPL